jgi:hypothetical protein
MAGFRLIGTMNTIPIVLPGSDFRQIHMPNLIGALFHRNAMRFMGRIMTVEKTEFNLGRILRK